MADEKKVVMHKHYEMGRGKYKYIGVWSAPSSGTLESNPHAYNSMMESKPSYCRMCCDHCHTGIIHHHIIEDEDGKRFSVGSSCIAKLNQTELVTEFQKAEKERKAQLRIERGIQRQMERNAAYELELDEQRKKNGGLTDHEVSLEERKKLESENDDKIRELSDPIVALLKKAGGNFCYEMAKSMRNGSMPTGGAKRIVIEVMTKQHTNSRKNSKAYKEAYPEMEALFNSVESEFKTIEEHHRAFLNKHFGFC